MDYGESTRPVDVIVTDDITWPWKVKLLTPIRLQSNISKTAWDAISNSR